MFKNIFNKSKENELKELLAEKEYLEVQAIEIKHRISMVDDKIKYHYRAFNILSETVTKN